MLTTMVEIRHASADDIVLLPSIERAAGEAFRQLGMDAVADDEPASLDDLRHCQQAGRLFVADDEGRVVAYLMLEVTDRSAHIEQVTVHPDAAHRRIGSALIDAAERWAGEHGLTRLTLTTFQHVPWNAPYYASLGFDPIPESEQTPELRAIHDAETARGLDAWTRIAMRRLVAHRQ